MIIKQRSNTILLDAIFMISAIALLHSHITQPQTRRKLSVAEQHEIIDHKRSCVLKDLSQLSDQLATLLNPIVRLQDPYKTKALVTLTALQAEETLLAHRLQLPSRCQWLKGSMRHYIRLCRLTIYNRRVAQLGQQIETLATQLNNTATVGTV